MANRTNVTLMNDELNRKQIFYFSGNLTFSRDYDIAGHTIPYIKPEYETIFDLSSANEIDSTFLAELIYIRQQMRKPIIFRNIPEKTRCLVQITSTESIFFGKNLESDKIAVEVR